MVGMLQEPGEHLHHAGVEPAVIGRQVIPLLHIGIVAGQHRIRRHDAPGKPVEPSVMQAIPFEW